MNIMERKNTDLIKEFNRYMREHPELADSIPNNSVISMQLEGDESFNKWSGKMAREHMEKDQFVVYIRIKKIKPLLSRIEELEIEPHAVY
jgi:hypothetical protein